MKFTSNQWQIYDLDTMVLDLNGTLQVKWEISEKTENLIQKLKSLWRNIIVLTWDQRWDAHELEKIWLQVEIAKNGNEKEAYIKSLDTEKCVCIWNARIDIWMFKNAKISIATIQAEGIHTGILEHVDIIIPTIEDALSLFIDWDTFSATMKI